MLYGEHLIQCGSVGSLEGFVELLSSNSPIYDIPWKLGLCLCLRMCQESAKGVLEEVCAQAWENELFYPQTQN